MRPRSPVRSACGCGPWTVCGSTCRSGGSLGGRADVARRGQDTWPRRDGSPLGPRNGGLDGEPRRPRHRPSQSRAGNLSRRSGPSVSERMPARAVLVARNSEFVARRRHPDRSANRCRLRSRGTQAGRSVVPADAGREPGDAGGPSAVGKGPLASRSAAPMRFRSCAPRSYRRTKTWCSTTGSCFSGRRRCTRPLRGGSGRLHGGGLRCTWRPSRRALR